MPYRGYVEYTTPELPYTFAVNDSISLSFSDNDDDDHIVTGQEIATLHVKRVSTGVESDIKLQVSDGGSIITAGYSGGEGLWEFTGLHSRYKTGQLTLRYAEPGATYELIYVDFYW